MFNRPSKSRSSGASNSSGSFRGRVLPEMLEIPKERAELKSMLRSKAIRGNFHPGLLQAMKSERNRRSPRNAYILLLGQTGAGKSSTINFLFENQDMTKIGDRQSETSEILEFSASVPIPELGTANTEIRVIDTPGLGDTGGIENDAKFIATLDSYLKNHEDLSNAIPNIVFIVARFDDNRIDGPASGFVRMLKGVKILQDRLIDPTYANIIVVLTHFMNAKKEIRRNPSSRYEIVRKIMKDVGFPEPIIILGAENEAIDKDLEEMNGYYKLPSGECYPYNIFQRIQHLTITNDPMGEAIIRTAFIRPAWLLVHEKCRVKLNSATSSPMYIKVIEQLLDDIFQLEKTAVSAKLDHVWNTVMHPDIRKLYPGTLNIVKNMFQIRQIRNLDQLPKTTEEILKLLKEIPQNEGISMLLERALGIAAPNINTPILVGNGYNVLEDISVFSPFVFTGSKPSAIGYKIPVGIRCDIVNETDDVCIFTRSRNEYATRRLTDLKLPEELVPLMARGNHIRSGYNVMQQFGTNNSQLSTLREHRMFQLTLEPGAKLSRPFLDDCQALPNFAADQSHIRLIWKDFFSKYGTHVVTSAYGGGSIETFVEENDAKKLIEMTGGDLDKAMARLSSIDKEFQTGESSADDIHDIHTTATSFSVKFKGGSMRYHKSNLAQIDKGEAAAALENWRESLAIEPIMLETKLKLVPLSYYMKSSSQKLASEIDKACQALFSTAFQYVPDTDTDPPRREDILSPSERLDRTSCLKAGTRILMADGSSKPVDDIRQGDFILDKDLKPTSVIGCNYFFLGKRHFYGFSPEPQTQFFTQVHIFVGPPATTYRVVSKKNLLEENPCFENYGCVEDMEGEFEILHNDGFEGVRPLKCQLFEDMTDHPMDTPVYFLEVDSPSGTYFANGFLCRHELPPFHLWPNTFSALQEIIFVPDVISKFEQIPFTPSSLQYFSEAARCIAEGIRSGLESGKFLSTSSTKREIIEDQLDVRKNLGIILSHKSLAAFGLLLYGKCGKVLYEYLDKQEKSVNTELIKQLVGQHIQEFLL